MGANVTVDDLAFSDPRFGVLAQLLGLADADHARAKVERLWLHCTHEGRYVLPEVEVAAVLGDSGVIALITARLGRRTRGGIYLKGTKGRIEWYGKLLKASTKGVAARRAKKADHQVDQVVDLVVDPLTLTPTLTLTLPESDPEVTAPPSGEVAEESDVEAPEPEEPERQVGLFAILGGAAAPPLKLLKPSAPEPAPTPPPKEKKRREKVVVVGYAEFVAHWDERFRERTGEAYHWGDKAGKQVKDLLERPGGLETATRRTDKLFDDPPKFLRGVPDLATLQAHWDKLAEELSPTSARDGATGYADTVDEASYPETGWADVGAALENM